MPKGVYNRTLLRTRPPEERFLKKIEQHGECWLWTGYKKRYGYFNTGSGIEVAHRFSYRLYHGPIPGGLYVCHKCDVPSCVNPDHLFLGTQFDNMQDMFSKGRENPPSGLRNAKAKLTFEQVENIKLDGRIYREIASSYNTSIATVGKIKNNQTRRIS